MKVLFLDFDGVLNSIQHFIATKDIKVRGASNLNDADLWAMKRDVNPNNMWVLKYIMEKVPDLKIVISSSWRLHYHMESFKELFKIFKLDGERIIDFTPQKLSSERYHEIHLWIADVEHPGPLPHDDCPISGPCSHCDNPPPGEMVDHVAVDDHAIYHLGDPEKETREVLTDPWVGLTMPDAFKIIKHFKPDFKEPYVAI